MTQGEFLAHVRAAFGARTRQHPEMYPADVAALKLLSAEPGRAAEGAPPLLSENVGPAGHTRDVAALLRSIAALLTATEREKEDW